MKIVILLFLCSGTSFADEAAKVFVTGFANALNVQMGGVPYTAPQQTQQVVVVQPLRHVTEIKGIRSDGSEGPTFYNYDTCWRFVNTTFGFASCASITRYY